MRDLAIFDMAAGFDNFKPLEVIQGLNDCLAQANRDPEVFDDPGRYDVRRKPNHHVAFGFGTHFCLGAWLARLEIKVMFEELLRRLPDMRLQPYADPQIQPAAFARGLKSLRVEFTPTRKES